MIADFGNVLFYQFGIFATNASTSLLVPEFAKAGIGIGAKASHGKVRRDVFADDFGDVADQHVTAGDAHGVAHRLEIVDRDVNHGVLVRRHLTACVQRCFQFVHEILAIVQPGDQIMLMQVVDLLFELAGAMV